MKKGLLFLVGISILFCSCNKRTKVDIETYKKEIDLLLNKEKHPYTHALKACIPQIGKKEELTTIKGFIEKNNFLYNEKCIFADRCDNSINVCFNKKPVFKNGISCHNPL